MKIETLPPGGKVTAPGVYRIDMATYHSSCCDGPSVSSSGLRQIIGQCPAFYWGLSYLNPDAFPTPDSPAFSFGRAAHCLIVGGEAWEGNYAVQPVELGGKAWNGNRTDCRAWKADAEARGMTVLSAADFEHIQNMAAVMKREPLVSTVGLLDGEVELSMVWQDEETGIWLKSRPDTITGSGFMADYKTTEDCSVFGCVKALRRYRYDIQAALAIEGLRQTAGIETENFALVFQMKKAPYLVTFTEVDVQSLETARVEIRRALKAMRHGLDTGEWPGYADQIPEIGLDQRHIETVATTVAA